jgi:NAD(P)H-dependent FMN reductase
MENTMSSENDRTATRLGIIVGSTRPTRAADVVVPWVLERARAHGAFDVQVLDLRDWPLPLFQEHMGSIGDFADPTYSDPLVRRWNQTIKALDAVLVVTPEYNHSVPAALKNAFDSVFVSFALRNKPLAAVGYSGGLSGAVRAIEHLAHIAIEAEMVPLRNTVILPQLESAFQGGRPTSAMTEVAMTVMLDDLAWWSRLLAEARAAGELRPGSLRARAVLAAAAAR